MQSLEINQRFRHDNKILLVVMCIYLYVNEMILEAAIFNSTLTIYEYWCEIVYRVVEGMLQPTKPAYPYIIFRVSHILVDPQFGNQKRQDKHQ